MKRYGNLYDKVISLENLRQADRNARKGKTDSFGVKVFDQDPEGNLAALHKALAEQTFTTSPYSNFTIYEPKERLISRLPYFPDRIVHHAIVNVVGEIWSHSLAHNTHSCIKGRGLHSCAVNTRKIVDHFRGRPLYCLKFDVRKFYPSVDHAIMKTIIRRKIKDARLLWLIDDIIDSADGLPIGNHTSAYLANLYLSPLIHYINERMPEDIRRELQLEERPDIKAAEYADDFPVLADNKTVLHAALRLIRAFLRDRLKLELKQNYQIFPVAFDRQDTHGRGIDFVGYVFYRNETRLRKSIKQNLCRAIARLRKRKKPITEKDFKQIVASWWGWAKHGDTKYLINKLNQFSPHEIKF